MDAQQPHGTTGSFTWLSDELEYVTDFNDFGQVAGDGQSVLLWTPTQAHATAGRLTRIPNPDGSDGIAFSALSRRGALAGSALTVWDHEQGMQELQPLLR